MLVDEVLSSVLVATLDAIVPFRRLIDARDALLETGKRSRRKVAVILNRVPALFDAADVGFVFIDVMGSRHRGTPVRSKPSTKPFRRWARLPLKAKLL
jgi:hypothetical protein